MLTVPGPPIFSPPADTFVQTTFSHPAGAVTVFNWLRQLGSRKIRSFLIRYSPGIAPLSDSGKNATQSLAITVPVLDPSEIVHCSAADAVPALKISAIAAATYFRFVFFTGFFLSLYVGT